MKALLRRIRQILRDRRTRRIFTRFVSTAAAIVVFVTTYALVLPAITMESQASCGLEAHQHDESCFEEVLICEIPESPGHRHDDSCYATSSVLTCEIEEHEHSAENGCYDANGDLVCEKSEHVHSDDCFEEEHVLTCELEESDGHTHGSACYEKVLTCGKEVHTHSTACYDNASHGTAGSTESAAVASTESAAVAETEGSTGLTDRVSNGASMTGDTAASASTDAAAVADSNGYVPVLEELDFHTLLNKNTGIYYSRPAAPADGSSETVDITGGSAADDITSVDVDTANTPDAAAWEDQTEAEWNRIEDATTLTESDKLRLYLSYTVPAGSLNATNPTARYRLPSNITLTDEQVEQINTTVNGIANQYVNLDTLEILDYDNYQASLGIEAVEGDRRPDQNVEDYLSQNGGQEFIAATVRVENVWDEGSGAYLGQDLVFTFTSYTVGRNQHEYDSTGQPTKAGEKVSGWVSIDITTDQIDWISTESVENGENTEKSAESGETGENTEKSAEIVFVEKNKELGLRNISTELTLVSASGEGTEETDDAAEARTDETDDAAEARTEENKAAETAEDETADAEAADSKTVTEKEDEKEAGGESTTVNQEQEGSEEAASDDADEEAEEVNYPEMSFDDSITVAAGSLSTDTEAVVSVDDRSEITVHVEADADTFPEGTTMVLAAVDDMDTVAEAVEGTVEASKTNGFHAVDISFRDADGKEIEPLKPIRVSMRSDAIQRAVENASTAPLVVHISDPVDPAAADANRENGESHADGSREKQDAAVDKNTEEASGTVRDEPDHASDKGMDSLPAATVIEASTGTTAEGAGKDDRDAADTLIFTADEFSVFAIVYTVDFEYSVNGKMYQFSLPGGEKIALSDLIEVLGITGDTNNGEKATFNSVEDFLKEVANVEFSDESLVKVTKSEEGNDWTLESLAPFDTEESLTITMKNGDVVTVKVTDAQVTDISGLLDSLTISGAEKQSDGSYKVIPGEPYTVSLFFKENTETTFSKNGPVTYQLPAGVKVPAGGLTGTLEPSDESLKSIYSVNYTISENGQITYNWVVKDGKQADFEALTGLFISMDIGISFDETQSNIDWDGKAQVVVDRTHDLSVSKNGWYSASDNKMHYSVTVRSKGQNSNIVLTDTISGTALTLDRNSMQEGNHQNHGITYSNVGDKGFTATIPSMSSGEQVTIEYTASVDLAKLEAEAKQNNGSAGSVTTTGNNVALQGSDDDPSNNTDEYHEDHSISYSSVNKSSWDGNYENGKRTMFWEISANDEHIGTISYIRDQMATGSDKMQYSGDGITVTVYNKDGDEVTSYDVPWSTLGVTNTSKGWTYNIPEQYKREGYSYTVGYKTSVDIGDAITDMQVSNTATTDYGSVTGSGEAEPRPGNELTMQKEVAEVDLTGGTISWDITFDVPESGLSSCVVTDYLPNATSSTNLGYYFDGYDSYTTEGLIAGETVTVSTGTTTKNLNGVDKTYTDKVIFTFHKQDESGNVVDGLYPVSNGRPVTIHLTTKLDEDWLKVEPTQEWERRAYFTHTNKATVRADGVEKSDEADVYLDSNEPQILKKNYFAYNQNANYHKGSVQTTLPAYMYQINLLSVKEDSFDEDGYLYVEDTFPADYLKYFERSDIEANGGQFRIDHGTWMSGTELGILHQHITYSDDISRTSENNGKLIEAVVSDGRVVFKVHKDVIQKTTDGSYYPLYSIYYGLVVKSPEVLEQMKLDAKAAGGTLKLKNTAVWGDLVPAETDVDYNVPVLDKSVAATDAAAGKYEFTLNINENADQLGTADYLTVTDTGTNLSVDYDSIVCTPADAVVAINHSGNTITYTVKNKTAVQIKYTAWALSNGNFSNTVEMNSQIKTADGTASITARGNTGTNDLHLTVLKHEYGNMLDTLPGAEFKLYLYEENFPDNYDPEKPIGDTLSTNAQGKIQITVPAVVIGTEYQRYSAKYALVETKAPDGFQKSTHPYIFTLSKDAPNYGQYVYLDNDTLPVANRPVPEDEITIQVKKTWVGTDQDEELPDVTIRLYQKETKYSDSSTAEEIDSYTLTAEDLNSETGKQEHTFEHLEYGKAYFVKEDPVPGYIAAYTDDNTLGLTRSGEIGITNTKQKITVEKVWQGGEPDSSVLRGLNINLLKDGEFFKTYTVVPDDNEWKLEIDDLEFPGEYTIQEPKVSGYKFKSIIYTQDGNTVSSITGTASAVITNEKDTTPDDETKKLSVQKKWFDGETELTDEQKENLSATVELVRYRAEKDGVVIHFLNRNGEKIDGKFADDITVKKNATIQMTLDVAVHTNTDNPVGNVRVTDIEPDNSWNTMNLIQSNGTKPNRVSDGIGWEQTGTITISFTTGEKELFFIKETGTGFSNPQVNNQYLAEAGTPEIDPTYTNTPRVTLNYANYWADSFIDLPVSGTGSDGKSYAYTYGIREISVPEGFELRDYSIDRSTAEGYEDATVVAEFGSTVTVNNRKAVPQTTFLTVQKRWQSNHTTWNPGYGEDLTIYFKLYKVKGDQKEQVNTTIYQLTKDTKINVAETDLGSDADLVSSKFNKNADGTYSIPFMIIIPDLPVLEDGWEYAVVECNASGTEFEQDKTFWTCLEFNNTTIAIKNDLTDVTAMKTWNDQSITGITHPAVTFSLYRTTDTIPDNSWSNETGYDHLENINWGDPIDTATIATGATGDALTAKWTDLPKYDITNGLLYTYYVKEATVDGYTLNSRGLVGGDKYQFTFENKLDDKTAFEFSKIWNDIGSQPITWPGDATIKITLNAYTDSATQTAVLQDQTLTFSPTVMPDGWSVETSSDGKKTTFKVEGLAKYSSDGKELTYYVTETQVDGYKAPSYATSEGNGLVFTGSDVPKATNGQQIINTPVEGYELPSTGGPGTRLFTILGSILILGAGVLLWRRRRLI